MNRHFALSGIANHSFGSVRMNRMSRLALAALGLAAGTGMAQAPAPSKPHTEAQNRPAGTLLGGSGMAADFSSVAPTEQEVHLMVGRSTFVNTKHRMTRVYVANPALLDSYTASPNQVVLTAKKAGTSSVVVWDEAGETQSFIVTSGLDLTSLRTSLKDAMPNENLSVRESDGHIVLSGTTGSTQTSDAALKLVTTFSKDVSNATLVNSSRVKQVKLKVRIVEVDRSKINQFAFNFFSQGGKNIANTTTGQYPSNPIYSPPTGTAAGTLTTSNPLNFLFFSSKLNVGATLQDLETMNLLQILAEPELTTMSGVKADFLAGGEFPFPIVSTAGGVASVSIEFKPYGVKLAFTPVVNVDGTIDLKVAPEVSTLDFGNAVTINGTTVPALATRRAETQLVLRSGETYAISGLLDKQTQDVMSKTPGIANIPIIGQLFKSKNNNHSTQELYVVVTPTIVDPLSEQPEVPNIPKVAKPFMDPNKFDKNNK